MIIVDQGDDQVMIGEVWRMHFTRGRSFIKASDSSNPIFRIFKVNGTNQSLIDVIYQCLSNPPDRLALHARLLRASSLADELVHAESHLLFSGCQQSASEGLGSEHVDQSNEDGWVSLLTRASLTRTLGMGMGMGMGMG